jgi:tol-pal system protein YbgF
MRMRFAAMGLVIGVLVPGVATADTDKEHKLIMAEIRMLQEEQQQVRQTLATLNDTLKAINARMDADASRYQKVFADQKLAVESVAEAARVLREKADETAVRLSTMAQELQSIRQSMSSINTSTVPSPTGDPAAADPSAASTATSPVSGGSNPPAPNLSPTVFWDRVYATYTAGQFDLAVDGFQSYIRAFPTSPRAAEAQLYTGHSYYNAGKYAEAAAALQKTITDYPQSSVLPEAYYKLGTTYEALKQFDQARRALETVIKNYNGTASAQLASQVLMRVRDKKED